MRNFDSRFRGFQSSELGTIIKSKRKFGFEIELVNNHSDEITQLEANTPESFGFVTDGSIEGNRNDAGVEIISPILAGLSGENITRELFTKIQKYSFRVNRSCGLHIHLDGSGFKNDRRVRVCKVKEIDKDLSSMVRAHDSAFIVRKDIVDLLLSNSNYSIEQLGRILLDAREVSPTKTVHMSDIIDSYMPDIYTHYSQIINNGNTYELTFYDFADPLQLDKDNYEFQISDLLPAEDDLLFIVKKDSPLLRVKTLLYLFSVYNDIFMSMLPESRRTNVFCQGLTSSFAPNQIEGIRTYTELENSWYKTNTAYESNQSKGTHYDNSRYYNINLHPLFSNGSTIEIRSHSGTMRANKVLLWASFHQTILDNIVSGDITIDDMRSATLLYNLDEKIDHFLHVVKPSASLQKYMLQRIAHFTNNNK